jgi:PAS domain S-box-containing protein
VGRFTGRQEATPRALERLRADRDRIVESWARAMRASGSRSAADDVLAVVDGIPAIVDATVDALAGRPWPAARRNELARAHGLARALAGWSPDELYLEFETLRRLFGARVEHAGVLGGAVHEEVIASFAREAIAAHTRHRDAALDREREAEAFVSELRELLADGPIHFDLFEGAEHVLRVVHPRTRALLRARPGGSLRAIAARDAAIAPLLALLDRVYTDGEAGSIAEIRFALPDVASAVKDCVFRVDAMPWRVAGRVRGVVCFCVDVTEAHEARRALEEANGRVEALLTEIPDPVFLAGRDGRFVVASHSICDVLGAPSVDRILGTRCVDWLDVEAAKLVLAADAETLRTGRTQTIELEIGSPGSERTFLSTRSPVRDARGAIVGIAATLKDITDRKKEERVRTSLLEDVVAAHEKEEAAHARLRAIFDDAPMVISIHRGGPDFRYEFANRALRTLYGGDPRDRSPFDYFPASEAAAVRRTFDEVFSTGRTSVAREIGTKVGRDRGPRWFDFVVQRLPDEADGPRAIAFCVETTHEVRARRAIEQTAKRLSEVQAVIEAAPSRTASADDLLAGAVDYAISAFSCDAALFLLESESGRLRVRAGRGVPEDALARELERDRCFAGEVFSRGPVILDDDAEIRGRCPFLRGVDARHVVGVPLRTDHPIGAIILARTSDKRFGPEIVSTLQIVADRLATAVENAELYERARAGLRKLQEERVLREQFVATLSHDLRTPLSAAKIGTQIAMRTDGLPTRVHDGLARVVEALDRIDKMIRDLLDANRLRAGEPLPLQLATCDLVEVVRAVARELVAIHGDRFRVRAEGVVEGRWDGAALRRVLENLAANAAKYGDPATPVEIELAADAEKATIAVRNEGDPIPEDRRADLFLAFRRGRKDGAGWGVGLVIVKGIVEAHGGRVSVECGERSTAFVIELPR